MLVVGVLAGSGLPRLGVLGVHDVKTEPGQC